jgi:hypothetical protein
MIVITLAMEDEGEKYFVDKLMAGTRSSECAPKEVMYEGCPKIPSEITAINMRYYEQKRIPRTVFP